MALDGNRLGDALKAAVEASLGSYINQGATPVNAAAYREVLWRAVGNAIVNEITTNATIESLTVTMTPNDGSPHTHSPSTTDTATGKIS